MDFTRFDAPDGVTDTFGDLFAPHRRGNSFFNPWQHGVKPKFTDIFKWKLSHNPYAAEKKSEKPVSPVYGGLERFRRADADAKVLWMGHASFLVELDGFRCLIDPVYGTVGAFVRRFAPEPFPLDALPVVDAVFLTHGHYDHLDVQTLNAIAEISHETRFFVGLGQERYLPKSCAHVHPVDWWDEVRFGGVSATFVPIQHWHRRGPFDYNTALWGAWVLRGSRTVFHAGDSGYFDELPAYGRLFEIDCALLPVGAYEPRWFMKPQHMDPREALQAFDDLGADRMIGMHWGHYDLTDEPLNRGAELVRGLAEDRALSDRVHVLRPGDWRPM